MVVKRAVWKAFRWVERKVWYWVEYWDAMMAVSMVVEWAESLDATMAAWMAWSRAGKMADSTVYSWVELMVDNWAAWKVYGLAAAKAFHSVEQTDALRAVVTERL
jgi:hypothetical protein